MIPLQKFLDQIEDVLEKPHAQTCLEVSLQIALINDANLFAGEKYLSEQHSMVV